MALALLIIFFTVNAFQGIQEQSRNEKERQVILEKLNHEIENNQYNASVVVKENVSNEGDIQISPSPIKPVLEENTEPEPEKVERKINTTDKEREPDHKAIGRIMIDKINVDYPILDTTTKETLNISIALLYGKALNKPGNIVLAGHNKKDGSLFGRLKELHQDDIIILQDNAGKYLEYKVFEIYIVEPTDLKPLNQDTEGKTILTLITCTNKGKQRLIIKACVLE